MSASRPLPSLEELRAAFVCDSENGKLSWRTPKRGRRPRLGFSDGHGYLRVNLGGRMYRIHRIIWKMTTGTDPVFEIDHINGIKSDNRILNLRDATHTQNARNKSIEKRNSTGLKGVTRSKAPGRWTAAIRHEDKRLYLGSFGTPEEAHEAYWQKAQEIYGEFARRN